MDDGFCCQVDTMQHGVRADPAEGAALPQHVQGRVPGGGAARGLRHLSAPLRRSAQGAAGRRGWALSLVFTQYI